ncbi:hypothetical protein DFH09DRAFT_1102412 [Mycena vulgaris]|nr:hypothetical protein DFH09DRAFT_1102412 [Mycena vulgaris]
MRRTELAITRTTTSGCTVKGEPMIVLYQMGQAFLRPSFLSELAWHGSPKHLGYRDRCQERVKLRMKRTSGGNKLGDGCSAGRTKSGKICGPKKCESDRFGVKTVFHTLKERGKLKSGGQESPDPRGVENLNSGPSLHPCGTLTSIRGPVKEVFSVIWTRFSILLDYEWFWVVLRRAMCLVGGIDCQYLKISLLRDSLLEIWGGQDKPCLIRDNNKRTQRATRPYLDPSSTHNEKCRTIQN